MSAAHTPGPWCFVREGFSTVYVEARIRIGVFQEVAACGPTEAGREQQEANARLIAAAPELLAALIEATDVLECLRRGYGVLVSEKCYPALNNCRDALAKAIGSATPRFPVTSCSQCGGELGPGDAGFSHCSDHATGSAK